MSLKYEEIRIPVPMGKDFNSYGYVWSRDSGNLVIVVIDDFWDNCLDCWNEVDVVHRIFPLLKKYAFTLPDTHAIGFFPLAADDKGADNVLEYIQKWLKKIGTEDTIRVYFLVDVMSGNPHNPELAYQRTKDRLECLYKPEHVRNLTGSGGTSEILNPDEDFVKSVEVAYILTNKTFSAKLLSFLGIGLHKDKFIDNAIQFYATPWEVVNNGCEHPDDSGWCHNCLEDKESYQLKTLADWLDDSVSICDLYDWEHGQSAKSLMIWVGEKLWGDHRPIEGKVLKAAMKKLRIPLSEDPSIPVGPIDMPCTPCLPFLISLKNFLWCCQNHKKPVPVKEICFFQDNEHCGFRLILSQKLENPDNLKEMYCRIKSENGKNPSEEHPLVKSLVQLTYCITGGLPEDMGKDYMRLFTKGAEIKGTKTSVVEVKEIAEDRIEVIWDVE